MLDPFSYKALIGVGDIAYRIDWKLEAVLIEPAAGQPGTLVGATGIYDPGLRTSWLFGGLGKEGNISDAVSALPSSCP